MSSIYARPTFDHRLLTHIPHTHTRGTHTHTYTHTYSLLRIRANTQYMCVRSATNTMNQNKHISKRIDHPKKCVFITSSFTELLNYTHTKTICGTKHISNIWNRYILDWFPYSSSNTSTQISVWIWICTRQEDIRKRNTSIRFISRNREREIGISRGFNITRNIRI